MPGRSHRPPQETASGNWSDGETTTLIDAWGPLHLCRRPGGLFLEDWRAAARAVNAHRAAAGRRFNRSRVQCQTRVRTLKKRYKEELPKQPPSEWRYLPRLHAFLSSPDDSPPGFPATAPAIAIKQEVEEEEEEVVVDGGGIGLAASWTVPRRPRNAAAGTEFSPGAVVVKLAEVYERVELAKVAAEKVKTETEQEMEMQKKAMFDAVKMEQ